MKSIEFLKNPFNYTGAKYKLLPQLLPLFPDRIDNFVDLFGGGGEVSLNVKANSIVYNDKCKPLVNIFKNLDNDFVNEIKEIIYKFLSRNTIVCQQIFNMMLKEQGQL